MRADTRTTRKTAYRNSIYVQGNTARRLEVLPQIEQPHRRVSEQTHRNRARARPDEYRLCIVSCSRYGCCGNDFNHVSVIAVGYHEQH